MRELSRDRTRFLGLVARPARRRAPFLAERIRGELPDTPLASMLASDIRYLDPAHAAALEGMLIAHAERNGDDAQSSISLTNEAVRSAFLATRRALGGHVARLGAQISIIGNGGLWKIGPDADAGGSRRALDPPPIGWNFVLVLTFAVLAIVVAW